jgi:multidrug resistance efflux pump
MDRRTGSEIQEDGNAGKPEAPTTTLVEAPPEAPRAAPAAPADQPTLVRRSAWRTGLRRVIVTVVVLAVLTAGGYFGYNYYRNNQLYVSTDDALVDSNLVPIAAPTGGTLMNWRIRPGDTVRAGQAIGAVRTGPAGVNIATINIIAPENGTILKVDAKEGQIIGTAQEIAFMADLTTLTITAYVNEKDVYRLRPGQDVDVTVDGTGATQYPGTLSEIVPAAASQFALIQTQDRGSGNFTKVVQRIEIHIELGDTGGMGLYPGMNAKVRIHVA